MIQITIAKQQLTRINNFLSSPHLLVGGLAVNQYTIRDSSDIDLVIDYCSSLCIIKNLYPTIDWECEELNSSEYRPSYIFRNRRNSNITVHFGPKIKEREPYKFMPWKLIMKNANTFILGNQKLDNILIPNTSSLAFIKLLSFIERFSRNPNKAINDLVDFADLTNHTNFSIISFFDLLQESKSVDYIKENAHLILEHENTIKKSCLFHIFDILFNK